MSITKRGVVQERGTGHGARECSRRLLLTSKIGTFQEQGVTISSFRDLDVWKDAVDLAEKVYRATIAHLRARLLNLRSALLRRLQGVADDEPAYQSERTDLLPGEEATTDAVPVPRAPRPVPRP